MKLSGAANHSLKTQKLNSEVSPHRAGIYYHLHVFCYHVNWAVLFNKEFLISLIHSFVGLLFFFPPNFVVSAVRLMRIEHGGAFADLLNEKGKGSGENEMGYVQRTLGFRTRELNHHDLRLVVITFNPFSASHSNSKYNQIT